MANTNDRPIITIRDGALKASIWENKTDDGKTFHSVTFGRTFTAEDNSVKSANSFSGGDILKISRLAEKAYDQIASLRLQQSQQQEAA